MSIRSNVDARAFDQRITFQRKTTARDGTGDPVPTWADLVPDVPSKVDGEAAGGERYINEGIRGPSDYTFWIRADVFERFGITLLDRIIWNGEPFNIADIPNQQLRGRLTAIIARTGLNAG